MSSKKFEYLSIGKKVDGTTYCSAVETLAENLIEDNEQDAVIVFPSKDGWASMRSSSYRMTTENAEAQLPLPIYKVNKVLIKVPEIKIDNSTAGIDWGGPWDTKTLKNEKGENFNNIIDITNLVLIENEWQSLFLSNNRNDYIQNITKDNTFIWKQNESKISFLSTIYKIGFLIGEDISPVYKRLLYYALYNNTENYFRTIYGVNGESVEQGIVSFQNLIYDSYLGNISDVREWQFRIEYVPLTSKTKIRARKNEILKQEYIQPFNQRAEINAASAFGKNMWLTAQKTGCREIAVIKNYTKLNDIPPIGALVRHNGKKYRLVTNHYVQTNTVYIQVRHTLSENWSYRSKHVAVDQKYRNWSIPQDTLWRNLYWEDYLRVGTSLKESDNVNGGVALADILQGFYVDNTKDKTIDTFSWTANESLGNKDGGEVLGASLPCSTYGIANSLIFSASFKDNLSAGMRAVKWNEDGEYVCEEAMYCKADGTLGIANITFGQGCDVGASFDINDNMTILQAAAVTAVKEFQSVVYPSIIKATLDNQEGYVLSNVVQNPVFNKGFLIYKDPGEAIKFTYQIHLIGEDDCFFGNKFAEHNPLIKSWGEKRKFKVWSLKHYVREGADVLETIDSDVSSIPITLDGFLSVKKEEQAKTDEDKYGEVYTLTLPETLINAENMKAWAITDESNNIYLACNNASVRKVYFQLHHSLFNNKNGKDDEDGEDDGGNGNFPGGGPGNNNGLPQGTMLDGNGNLMAIKGEGQSVVGDLFIDIDVGIATAGFENCIALYSVTFAQEGVPEIGDYAFANCPSLQYIKFNCTYEEFIDIYVENMVNNWLADLEEYVRIEFYGEGTTVKSITKGELFNQQELLGG